MMSRCQSISLGLAMVALLLVVQISPVRAASRVMPTEEDVPASGSMNVGPAPRPADVVPAQAGGWVGADPATGAAGSPTAGVVAVPAGRAQVRAPAAARWRQRVQRFWQRVLGWLNRAATRVTQWVRRVGAPGGVADFIERLVAAVRAGLGRPAAGNPGATGNVGAGGQPVPAAGVRPGAGARAGIAHDGAAAVDDDGDNDSDDDDDDDRDRDRDGDDDDDDDDADTGAAGNDDGDQAPGGPGNQTGAAAAPNQPAAPAPAPAAAPPAGTGAGRWATWGCVYRELPIDRLVSSRLQMLAIDPDGYQAAEVARIKASGKTVLAYLSIGEAEEYRWYYRNPVVRQLIIDENQDWQGNFRVKYWDSRWHSIMLDYVQRIQRKGFDGLYLDIADAWEDRDDEAVAKDRMVQLMLAVAKTFRAGNPRGVVLFQNSERLFDDARILASIDGMVQEGLFYTWMAEKGSASWREKKIARLQRIRQAGRFVGILEYTRDAAEMGRAKAGAQRYGFALYCATKDLETLFPAP